MNNLEITNIRLKLVENSRILAIASITINDAIVISGIRLFEGKKGYYILFPERNSKNRKFNVVFPCSNELREKILNEIQSKFIDVKSEQ